MNTDNEILGTASMSTRQWAAGWHGGQFTGLYSLASTGIYYKSMMERIYSEYMDIGIVPGTVVDEIEAVWELYCQEEDDYDEVEEHGLHEPINPRPWDTKE